MGSKSVFNVWLVLLHYPRVFLATQEMTNNNLTFIWMVSYVFYQCTCICICYWNLNNNFFWHKCTVIQTSRANIFNKMSSEYYNSMWFQVGLFYWLNVHVCTSISFQLYKSPSNHDTTLPTASFANQRAITDNHVVI